MHTYEENRSFLDTVDFSGVFRHAEEFAGSPVSFGTVEIRSKGAYIYAEVLSNDIASSCGIFGRVLKECKIMLSGPSFYSGEDGTWCLSLRGVLQYQHVDGVSNVMDLFKSWYTYGSWEFIDVGSGG